MSKKSTRLAVLVKDINDQSHKIIKMAGQRLTSRRREHETGCGPNILRKGKGKT